MTTSSKLRISLRGLLQALAVCVPCQYPSILNSSTRSIDDNGNKNNNDCRIKSIWIKTVTCANHRRIVIADTRKYLNHIHPDIFGSYHKWMETKVIYRLYKQLFEIQVSLHYSETVGCENVVVKMR